MATEAAQRGGAKTPKAALVILIGGNFLTATPELQAQLPEGYQLLDLTIKGATMNGNRNNAELQSTFFAMAGQDGYDQQVEHLLHQRPSLSESDVVIYGILGEEELIPMLELELVQMDRAIHQFVEVHAHNLQKLCEAGCRHAVLLQAEPEGEDARDLFRVMMEGAHGLYPRLPEQLETTLLAATDLQVESLVAAITLLPSVEAVPESS